MAATIETIPAISLRSPQGEFRNTAYIDFNNPENARAMREALRKVHAQLGTEYDLVIGGDMVRTKEKIKSLNPAKPSEVVGIHQKAGAEHVEPAMQAALKAFESWRTTSWEERASLLLNASEIIQSRRLEFNAWMVYEVGKNWVEADADTGETIDFLEFYAREALRLSRVKTPVQLPGERDELLYIPLGVGAVIPPWNFPFAIMAGMTSAAIVCGNTVILKPSSDSPTIAAKFVEVLQEAGMPEGVVNFCPGSGGTFGNALVEHPKTRFIAFTGSKEVGLDINQRAATPRKGQLWIKRTVLEMGGKDSIIVQADCDLDAAVEGVVASAFGFNGQKCSACSRAIVEESIYDVFLERLRDRVARLTQGDPLENKNTGPVVNEGAMKSILEYIEIGKREGRVISGGARANELGDGYYVQPTVIADIAPDARISQEEIFGPVLAVIKARDFRHSLEIANNTEYGLTGAIYTNNPEKKEIAKRDFHVGNLYINRKCTGAMVGAHPFGGFNMSGTDSKAGGPDYLYLFTQAKSAAEKVTR
ncbi:MAG: L-glutamate gamma-semialdehyde dehydrogenase [Acidobacteria bacterium]|nr:L-glutamate gamma-semialdehyde dehydrogenase [Acidobacteriota bacterium]MBV9146361.1 L-glutamate gamma-semialdehyde dehydrogenase [Acidobacteriota bacterium]